MKKIFHSMILFSCFCVVLYSDTTTSTVFGQRTTSNVDQYGNQLYNQSVTIRTQNYEVDTFWSRFFNPENKQKTYTQLSTSATAQIKVEASSACTLAGKGQLPSQGCSGQKPFLVNDETLVGIKNGDTISVIFQPAYDDASAIKTYNMAKSNTIYPMDIQRTAANYQSSTPVQSGSKQTFFGFFSGIFNFFFNKNTGSDYLKTPLIADTKYGARSLDAEDRRQRYIANIISGADQDHLLSRAYKGAAGTAIKTNVLNYPVSLLHYDEAKKATDASQCKFMFLSLSSDGFMCRAMTGFGMDAWMPFFTSAKISEVDVSMITIDTENALLAAAGKASGKSYQKITASTDTQKLSFLQQMLKPMTTMMSMMKTMMFGSSKSTIVSNPVEITYDLSSHPISLMLAVTNDGSHIDNFQHFKLTALRSSYGDMMNQCSVKYSGAMFGIGAWSDTFYASKGSTPSTRKKGSIDTHAEWITWCQESTGKKGMFDYLTDWSSGGFFNPFNWMEGMWSMFSSFFGGNYKITEFKNILKRGLILDLKKETLTPTNRLNSSEFKILNVKH
jgi:hypothetical protein